MSSMKKPKFQYNKKNMEEAVDAVQHGMSALRASQQFNVPRSTLRNIVSGKSTLKPRMGPLSTLGERNELMLASPSISPVPEGEITPTKLARILSPSTGGQNVPAPFKKNLYWQGSPKKKRTIRQIKLPAVVTSEKWRKYEEDRRNKKVEAERLKEERKRLREEKKKETEKKRTQSSAKRKKNVDADSSDSSENVPLLSEGEGDDWGQDSSDSEENARNSAGESLSENNYVIVTYNGVFFLGIIKRIIGDKFEISAMEKSGLN